MERRMGGAHGRDAAAGREGARAAEGFVCSGATEVTVDEDDAVVAGCDGVSGSLLTGEAGLLGGGRIPGGVALQDDDLLLARVLLVGVVSGPAARAVPGG